MVDGIGPISGHAEVNWQVLTIDREGLGAVHEYDVEAHARSKFDEACDDRSVKRAKVTMVVRLDACTHSKS